MDPDEVAKWSMGSEFATHKVDQSHTGGETATEIPNGIVRFFCYIAQNTSNSFTHMCKTKSCHIISSLFLSAPGSAAGGTGWLGQNTRFLHTTAALHPCYYQTRSLHDTVVARLTPEDIKKAREAKQALVKPIRQKVGWMTCTVCCFILWTVCIYPTAIVLKHTRATCD